MYKATLKVLQSPEHMHPLGKTEAGGFQYLMNVVFLEFVALRM